MIKVLTLLFSCIVLASSIKQRRMHYARPVFPMEFDRFYNFVVYVSFPCEDDYCFRCTGSLVSRSRILLAAHCLCYEKELLPKDTVLRVYLNSTVLGRGRMVTAKLEKRRDLNCTYDYVDLEQFQADQDVAIVRLDEPVTGFKQILLACGWLPEEGTSVTILGFGMDEDGVQHSLRIHDRRRLRKCDRQNRFPQVKGVYCVDANLQNLDASILDDGDSGGPLLVRTRHGLTIIGVHYGQLDMTNTKCNLESELETQHDMVSVWANVSTFCHWFATLPPESSRGEPSPTPSLQIEGGIDRSTPGP